MKISNLQIDKFRHLENLDFDFTYPDDFHIKEKRGKPLDKICFIGQSATGKTSLLDIFHKKYNKLTEIGISTNGTYSDVGLFGYVDINCKISFNSQEKDLEVHSDKIIINKREFIKSETGSFNRISEFTEKSKLFYFKASLISNKNLDIFNQHPSDLNEKFREVLRITNFVKKEKIHIFDDTVSENKWIALLEEYISYNKKFSQKMSELIHKGLIADTRKLEKEFKEWEKENPKTLLKFSEFFNPILKKLNLEVDLINTEFSIPIRDLNSEEIIPINDTSTGTKGLLLSFLPLFNSDSKNSIILIDEPERSLFPDIQMELMEHYERFSPNSQFIVATHSPFIAASFEPEERFILYFDENGKVAVRRGTSPIGDDPNDMLKNDFGVNYYNKFGEEAYKKYLKLKEDLAKEEDPVKKKKLLLETVKLGDTYNF